MKWVCPMGMGAFIGAIYSRIVASSMQLETEIEPFKAFYWDYFLSLSV